MIIKLFHRGSDHFLKPLLEHWRGKEEWMVVDPTSTEAEDVIWVEWANEQSIIALQLARKKNVIVRMLGSEYWQGFWRKWKTENLYKVIQSSGVTVIPGVSWKCIPPAIDVDYWTPTGEAKNNNLIVVGSFTYTKGHIGLLRILSERPKSFDNVIFVGNLNRGKDMSQNAETVKIVDLCFRYAKRYGINLTIEDKMSNEQLRSLYSTSGFLVCPAINSFSAVVGEALSCGCRAIVADWPGSWTHWPGDIIYTTSSQFWEIVEEYPLTMLERHYHVLKNLSPEVIYSNIDSIIEEAANG